MGWEHFGFLEADIYRIRGSSFADKSDYLICPRANTIEIKTHILLAENEFKGYNELVQNSAAQVYPR